MEGFDKIYIEHYDLALTFSVIHFIKFILWGRNVTIFIYNQTRQHKKKGKGADRLNLKIPAYKLYNLSCSNCCSSIQPAIMCH